MAVTIFFHRLALTEYRAAHRWYVRRSERAGRRFEDAIEYAIERIAESPSRWPIIENGYRVVRVARFPYRIYYRVLNPDEVLVVAVAHGRRRLEYWARRSWP
jgi:toxin ParE1/3/4